MFKNRSILITGGTGSFGQAFVKTVLENYQPARIVIFSRDELKQYEMQQHFNALNRPGFELPPKSWTFKY
jgi:UDP-N-acetylglucosamine 4,6-dehydratase